MKKSQSLIRHITRSFRMC